jgi:Cytochrome P460
VRKDVGILPAAAFASSALSVTSSADGRVRAENISPIFGVAITQGYRQWERSTVLGNSTTIRACRSGPLPFPDGTVLAKLARKRVPSPEFGPVRVPGASTKVQTMFKDSRKQPSTGGWDFGRFTDGDPVDVAQRQTRCACHQALAKGHSFVLARFMP